MHVVGRRGARASLPAALVGALLAGAPAAPAGAHPFGPPPTALVSAEGRTVTVRWTASPDDTAEIGVLLGLLPESTVEAFREAPTQVAPPAAAEAALDDSEALRGYLLQHLSVHQDGRACDGEVQPIEGFLRSGATVAFDCPHPVGPVDIRITMLHDVHEAYRTFAVTDGVARPPQAVYTVAEPEHRWRFGAGSGDAPVRGAVAVLAGAAALVAAGAAVALRRLRGAR